MRPPPLCVKRINLWVRNLEQSAAFYCTVFGLERIPSDPPSRRTCVCRPRNADDETGGKGTAAELVLTEGLPSGAEILGIDHFSVEVPTARDVVDMYTAMSRQGIRATRPRMYGGHWQTFVFDPDGYKIEVLTKQRPSAATVKEHASGRTSMQPR